MPDARLDGVGPYEQAKIQAELVCLEERGRGLVVPVGNASRCRTSSNHAAVIRPSARTSPRCDKRDIVSQDLGSGRR
ncbi:hypothetical protein [Sorangium sp. So ce363]|uniref:hypothetical protein n=1 Tax=Sorangium sp. So ce363 TaxID=3133304 RepID=UPI003F5F2E3B